MTAPLDRLKVVDIGWLMVGPVSARYLAELGADTIKVENADRPDPLRGLGPYADGVPGMDRSLSYHMINAGKRSFAVNVKTPEGLALVRQIVAGADVFIESFTPGAIDTMGLAYADLAKANPGLIMVSTGILGRKGSLGMGMSGTGLTGSAYAGATYLVGWPDRAPVGPYGPWTDAVAPRFVVASILAALHRRKTTGLGCYIDVAQAEAGLQFLSPAYLDYAFNGRLQTRTGSASDPLKAPCAAYRARGVDSWIVIDASAADAWRSLRTVVGSPLSDERFDTLVGRLRNREDLDTRIGVWTSQREGTEAEALLQSNGVPAHVICDDQALAYDADLVADGYHRAIETPVLGKVWIPGPQFALADTPHVPTSAGPTIGDWTDRILASELGLPAAEITELRRQAVVG